MKTFIKPSIVSAFSRVCLSATDIQLGISTCICFLSWQRAFPDGPKEELSSKGQWFHRFSLRALMSANMLPHPFSFGLAFHKAPNHWRLDLSNGPYPPPEVWVHSRSRRKARRHLSFFPVSENLRYETRIGTVRKAIQRNNEPPLRRETQHPRCSGFLLTYPCLRMIFVALAFVFCLLSDSSTLWLSPVPSGIISIHSEQGQENDLFGSSLTRTL